MLIESNINSADKIKKFSKPIKLPIVERESVAMQANPLHKNPMHVVP